MALRARRLPDSGPQRSNAWLPALAVVPVRFKPRARLRYRRAPCLSVR